LLKEKATSGVEVAEIYGLNVGGRFVNLTTGLVEPGVAWRLARYNEVKEFAESRNDLAMDVTNGDDGD